MWVEYSDRMLATLRDFLQPVIAIFSHDEPKPTELTLAEQKKICELMLDYYACEHEKIEHELEEIYQDHIGGVMYFGHAVRIIRNKSVLVRAYEYMFPPKEVEIDPDDYDNSPPVWRTLALLVNNRAVMAGIKQIMRELNRS